MSNINNNRSYYLAHAGELLAERKQYMQDDPDGHKRREARLSCLKCWYRKTRSHKTAVTLFKAYHPTEPVPDTFDELLALCDDLAKLKVKKRTPIKTVP